MKRLLGIDLGKARVGMAISDELGLLAHPLETFPADKRKALIERISRRSCARRKWNVLSSACLET